MKAFAYSVRIAPKKANIVAKMVRGMPVPAAMLALQRTHKKAARIIEELLKSAAANAEHNDKQHRTDLVIKTIVVNQGAAYRRGTPMARGRMRPMKKFLSHITLTLGIADVEDAPKPKAKKAAAGASKAKKSSVESKPATKKSETSPDSSVSSSPSSSN